MRIVFLSYYKNNQWNLILQAIKHKKPDTFVSGFVLLPLMRKDAAKSFFLNT